jgi:hypothetical protein
MYIEISEIYTYAKNRRILDKSCFSVYEYDTLLLSEIPMIQHSINRGQVTRHPITRPGVHIAKPNEIHTPVPISLL